MTSAVPLWSRLERLALNPLVLVMAIGAGVWLGRAAPETAIKMGALSDLYVRLLKMLVIPLVMSAIIYNQRRLFLRGGSAAFIFRTVSTFLLTMLIAAAVGLGTARMLHSGADLDHDTLAALGGMLQANDTVTGEQANLAAHAHAPPPPLAETIVGHLVPDNVFAALLAGDNLKLVFFAIVFGVAVALLEGEAPETFHGVTHTVFSTTLALTRHFSVLLPLASLAMTANLVATTGVEPLFAMPSFLLCLALATLIFAVLALGAIWLVSNDLGATLRGLRGPFFMAIATRNSIACLPQMIDGLTRDLRREESLADIVVPLGTSLVRPGPVLFYAAAASFVAAIYGHALGPAEMLVILGASVVAGFASAGMTGVIVVYQTALVCDLLKLPFEAALVLFLAVEPVSDILRTVTVVLGNMAISAVVCPAAPALEPLGEPAA